MSAVVMLLGGAGIVTASELATGELSRRVRLFVGDRGAAVETLGLDCVPNSSVMVLPECFRFSTPGWADIGRGEWSSGVAELQSYLDDREPR